MREAFFILIVLLVLFALTAFRYRKQIYAIFGVWNMLKTSRISQIDQREERLNSDPGNIPLVNCSKCGRWVPQTQVIRLPSGGFFCTPECNKIGTARH